MVSKGKTRRTCSTFCSLRWLDSVCKKACLAGMSSLFPWKNVTIWSQQNLGFLSHENHVKIKRNHQKWFLSIVMLRILSEAFSHPQPATGHFPTSWWLPKKIHISGWHRRWVSRVADERSFPLFQNTTICIFWGGFCKSHWKEDSHNNPPKKMAWPKNIVLASLGLHQPEMCRRLFLTARRLLLCTYLIFASGKTHGLRETPVHSPWIQRSQKWFHSNTCDPNWRST